MTLQRNISTRDIATQTESISNESSEHSGEEMVKETDNTWKTDHTSVEEMVKEAAEDAMKQTGFVYESTSGLYYDYNTGYYYNAVRHILPLIYLIFPPNNLNFHAGAWSIL